MIRAIAAMDERRGIARHNTIPWHIPADLAYFRAQTMGHIVLMGAKTYDTLANPLPNRRNVVASRTLQAVRQGFELVHDVPAFLREATEDVWIIGGAVLFEATLADCDELYITQVNGDFSCDRFFPEYQSDFTLADQQQPQTQNGYTFSFERYIKKPADA